MSHRSPQHAHIYINSVSKYYVSFHKWHLKVTNVFFSSLAQQWKDTSNLCFSKIGAHCKNWSVRYEHSSGAPCTYSITYRDASFFFLGHRLAHVTFTKCHVYKVIKPPVAASASFYTFLVFSQSNVNCAFLSCLECCFTILRRKVQTVSLLSMSL